MLIVEDDWSSNNALRFLLLRRGYEVIQAATVAAAMRNVDASLFAIILDLMLPDGDGLKILSHIRSNQMPVRVLITTGISDDSHVDEVEQMRPDCFLKKPINLADLLRGLAD